MGWRVKKIFLCLILICLILTGCGKKDEKTVLKEFGDKVNKTNNYKLTTRREEEVITKLLNYLNDSKNNTELIDYLYYEWFHNNKSNDKYNDLITEINSEYTEKHNELFKIIELINS